MARCGTCGGSRINRPSPQIPIRQTPASITSMAEGTQGSTMFDFDRDMILVNYTSPNRGDHLVIGHAIFSVPIQIQGIRMERTKFGYQINYGYHAGGSRITVHRDELLAAPHLFQGVRSAVPEIQIASQRRAPPPPPPTPIEDVETEALDRKMPASARQILEQELDNRLESPTVSNKRKGPFDLQTLPAISSDIAKQLKADGVDLPEDILSLGVDGIQKYKGIGKARAEFIIATIQKRMQDE